MELLDIAVCDDRITPRDKLTTLEDAINDINVFRKLAQCFHRDGSIFFARIAVE